MLKRILTFFGIKCCKFGCHDYNEWHQATACCYRKCSKCNKFEVKDGYANQLIN